MHYEQSDKKKFATVQQWIPFFMKLTNAREKVLASFVLWNLKYSESQLGIPLLGTQPFLFSGAMTQELLLWKYNKVVSGSVWLNSDK